MPRHPALSAVALTLLLAAPSLAQTRHADAHVHGTAHLTIVIAEDQVSMELSVPAADIVGFERQPRDDGEQVAIDEAIGTLSDPLSLFSFSPQVQCELASSKISFVGEHDDHEAEQEHGNAHEDHFEFAASFLLNCPAIPSQGLSLETRFFEVFPGSGTIEIEGLVDGGAIRASLAPHTPSAALRPLG